MALLSRFHVGGDQRSQHNAGEDDLEGYGGVHRGLSGTIVAMIGSCGALVSFASFQFVRTSCSLGSFLRALAFAFVAIHTCVCHVLCWREMKMWTLKKKLATTPCANVVTENSVCPTVALARL